MLNGNYLIGLASVQVSFIYKHFFIEHVYVVCGPLVCSWSVPSGD